MALNTILWPLALMFATFILLYHLSKSFKFYCKLVVYYLIILTVSFLAIPPALLRPFHVENTNIVAILMTTFSKIFNINVEIRGRENLVDKYPCVVICNHQSALDVIAMMELWPILKRCVSMVKKELRYALSFGVLATICGTIFIDRLNAQRARETTTNAVKYLKSKNTSVWIFPEGTRNCNGTMLPFKKGAFHIAVQGELPILPIVFSSYHRFYDPKQKLFESGNVIATVLPPISTKGLTQDDMGELIESTRNRMLEVFYETSNIDPKQIANGIQK